jgi:hypothetical protein
VSSDDEGREPEAIDPTTSTDAAGRASTDAADEPRPDPDGATHETTAALADIESKPLAERAPGYQALADRLRAELEQSDPSRGSS